jgi:hypothetical protein
MCWLILVIMSVLLSATPRLHAQEADLSKVSTERLIACFKDWKICGAADSTATGWEISEELSRRGETDRLIARYGYDKSPDIRNGIEHLAYHHQSRVAADYMRTVFTKRLDDGENLYWPAMYLAKGCDHAALQYLDPGPDQEWIADKFSVSSAQFAATAELFGKCRYRPAIPYLVVIGLHAASLNLVDAADQSLRRFYPTSPKFETLEAEQRYFCERANRDGFQLDCKAITD